MKIYRYHCIDTTTQDYVDYDVRIEDVEDVRYITNRICEQELVVQSITEVRY